MSNDVYGYIESPLAQDWNEVFSKIETISGIGIRMMPKSELYNFPDDLLPFESAFMG